MFTPRCRHRNGVICMTVQSKIPEEAVSPRPPTKSDGAGEETPNNLNHAREERVFQDPGFQQVQYEPDDVDSTEMRQLDMQDATAWHEAWREGLQRMTQSQRDTATLFNNTLKNAARTYKLLTIMSGLLFLLGIGLFLFAAVYAAFASAKVYSVVFAGLGASTFVAIFILRPFKNAQTALSDLIQAEVAFMSFFEQIRMWSGYVWAGGQSVDLTRADHASEILHRRTSQTMTLLQKYLEAGSSSGVEETQRATM